MGENREELGADAGSCAPVPADGCKKGEDSRPLSVGDYILMFFLFGIPLVNLIIMLVWGFGGNVNVNRKNCARAYLVLILIALLLSLILGVFGFLMAGRFGPALRDLIEARGAF